MRISLKRLACILTCVIFILILFTGCSFGDSLNKVMDNTSGDPNTTITLNSTDSKFSIDVPGNWSQLDQSFHEDSLLSVVDNNEQLFIVSMTEDKTLFESGITCGTYMSKVLSNMSSAIDDPVTGEIENATYDNKTACAANIEGTIKGYGIAYRVYAIEYDGYFLLLTAWSPLEMKDQAKDTFDKIISTVHVFTNSNVDSTI